MFEHLHRHWHDRQFRNITDLFESDPNRASEFSVTAADLYLDYSKTDIDRTARHLLLDLCSVTNLSDQISLMFSGDAINCTENRPALHPALRNLNGTPLYVNGTNVMPDVLRTLEFMEQFTAKVRENEWSDSREPIKDVVNIGIGGSDLGPAMATAALAPYHDGPKCHFVSNIDGAHISDTLKDLDPISTLLIVSSKTFSTIETMINARTARDWLLQGGGNPARQMVGITSSPDRAAAFGIDASLIFYFSEWVGGRYSLWGPTGLPIMLAIGHDAFRTFLNGAHDIDVHISSTSGHKNLPVMMALVSLWHSQICGYSTRAILPYDQRLSLLPSYLQQLEMESNGKGVQKNGCNLTHPACPIVWGAAGTNGQHAFYQLIHQGLHIVPCEFMVAAQAHEPELTHHHNWLIAHCLAQSEALMRGRDVNETRQLIEHDFDGAELERQARHRMFNGNRPSVTLLYPKLTPRILGQIIALYEYRVFIEGAILGINSFDQWGVELGKVLASNLYSIVAAPESSERTTGSTRALLDIIREKREK